MAASTLRLIRCKKIFPSIAIFVEFIVTFEYSKAHIKLLVDSNFSLDG